MRTTAILSLVRRLLTQEAKESQKPEALIEAAERVSNKLRVHLSKRVGQEGFRTLLVRALTLATTQFPSLRAVRVGADGSLVGLREAAGLGQTPNTEHRTPNTEHRTPNTEHRTPKHWKTLPRERWLFWRIFSGC